MNATVESPKRASLGSTAREVWHAWRRATDQRVGQDRIFGWTITLGEVFWLDGKLCRYVGYPGYQPLTERQEDEVWNDLCRGMLQIHRRRYAPIVGANYAPSAILHAATGEPLPPGTEH